jgi:SAM-dependent methyltransferase
MGGTYSPEWNVGLRRSPALWVVAVSGLLASIVFMRRRDGDRLRWYRVVYWLAYRLGLAVWRRPTPPADLVALVEGPSALPAGRALDLGCGTGTDAIYLATHGWDVTGVDIVPKSVGLRAPRRRSRGRRPTPRPRRRDPPARSGRWRRLCPDRGLRLLPHPARRPPARPRRRGFRGCRAGSDAAAVWVQATAQGRAHARRGDDR